MAWLASDFLLELRQAIGLAAGGASPAGLLDANLLPVADREIQTSLLPLLMSVREEFLVLKASSTLTTSTTRVRIPSRTIAGRIRDVRITVSGSERQLIRYEAEDRARFFPLNGGGAAPSGYYIEGEWLVLLPGAAHAATLDVYYFARPGRLTVTAADFVAIETNSSAGVPTGFAQLGWTVAHTFASLIDIVRGGSGLSTLFVNLAATDQTATNLRIDSTTALLVEAADYITKPDLCPVVPLPVELHGVLVARTAAAVLRQLGKYGEANAETKYADTLAMDARTLLAPRVTRQPKVVVGNLFNRRRRGAW